MQRRRAIRRTALGLALFAATTVSAGQLHTETSGLAHVASQSGGYAYALLGTVVSVDESGKRIHLAVERVYTRAGEKPRIRVPRMMKFDGKMQEVSTEKSCKEGDTLELKVYTGIVWDDPHESPVDRRLHGHLDFGAALGGSKVVYAQSELLPADNPTLRKLDLFFEPARMAAYRKDASVADLAADLADFDLYDTARVELEKREESLARHVISAMPETRQQHDPFMKYWYTLEKEGRKGFLLEAATYLKGKRQKARLERMVDRLTHRINKDDLPELLKFSALVETSLGTKSKNAAKFLERVQKLQSKQ